MHCRVVAFKNPGPRNPHHLALAFSADTPQLWTVFHRGPLHVTDDSVLLYEWWGDLGHLVFNSVMEEDAWKFYSERDVTRHGKIPLHLDIDQVYAWCRETRGVSGRFSLLRGNNCIDYVTQALRAGGAEGLPDRPKQAHDLYLSWATKIYRDTTRQSSCT